MQKDKNNITLSLQNIISFSGNLNSHLTGKRKIITFSLIILILSFINITLSFQGNSVSALSYQTYQRLDFIFNPTIQLTLSSSELTIPNLTPGSSSDSNIIDISVATNAFGGLNLISTVGNSSNDTTSLVYRNGNTTIGSFDALSTTVATLSDIDSNKYGYSYSVKENNDTWGNYSSYAGLPKYDDTAAPATLLSTTGTATSGAVKFKLGAKASTAQPSGTYTNVINFSATTKPLTTTYTINYIDSTGEAAPASLPVQVSNTIVEDTSGTLSSTIPTRSGGYTFKSWCTAPTNNNTCSGNIYKPGETYNISNIGEPVTVNLYAMWQGPLLYDLVASQVKKDQSGNPRTQTPAELQAVITTPTSTNPTEDTSNSGVYLYDATTYGVASDASNDYDIYYFRGILDTENGLGTYGSDGQADAYPNYVRLNDTCWRIVRTTGSGGVKMIYNGLYGATKANSCINAIYEADVSDGPVGLRGNSSKDDWYRNINRIGYTFNNSSDIQDISDLNSVGTVFGDNSNYSTTNIADSNIKKYIENDWFSKTIGNYENILEPSAGYCNDRTVYSNASINPMPAIEVSPYSTSDILYFGAHERNYVKNALLKLGCPRGAVDLYTTKNATDGNKQLKYPVALLTADEASLGGSGRATCGKVSVNSSNCSSNSYLNSGNIFWLLSPNGHSIIGAVESYLGADGKLNNFYPVSYNYGMRPVISLNHSVTITSGSGTATSPWVISPPGN